MRYVRREIIREQALGEERLLFDDKLDQVHVLNETAAFVWDCLARPATAAEVLDRVKEVFESSPGCDEAHVGEALRLLLEKGLARVEAPAR